MGKNDKERKGDKESEIEFELPFTKEMIIKSIPWLIILISSVVALWVMSPLYQAGVPMNIDLPFHYGRIACFIESDFVSLPSMWCPYGQAGIASYQAYAVVPFYAVFALNWIIPLEWAFKIMLLGIFFSLATFGFVLFYKRGYQLAGAFAYTLLLFEHGSWHSGGFDKIFFVGLFSNALGSAMMLLAMAFAFDLFSKPTCRNMIKASIVTGVFFLSHAASFMFFPIVLIIMALVYHENVKGNLKLFAGYPLLVILLVGFWFIPFLAKQDYYISSGGGNVKSDEISAYLFSLLPWEIIVIGVLGLGMMFYTKRKDMFVIGAVTLVIPLLWVVGFVWPSFPYFNYVQMIRNLAEMRTLILLTGGFFLGTIANTRLRIKDYRISLMPIALIALIVIATPLVSTLKKQTEIIILSERPEFKQLEQIYGVIEGAKGRVLVEDTLFGAGQTALSYSHPFAMSPALTKLELIGAGDNLYNKYDYSNTQQDILFDKNINEQSNEEVLLRLKDLNIEYVVAFRPAYREKFKNFSVVKEMLPWIIFKTPLEPSYFEIEKGKVLDSKYEKTSGEVEVDAPQDTKMIFKVRAFPNWKVKVDGNEVDYEITGRGMMGVTVPSGKHKINFEYGMRFVDYLGYLISLVGIVAAIVMWRKG